MGLVNIFARIGSPASPFACKSLIQVHKSAPFLTIGVLGLICFSVLFTLPETKCHDPKKESVDESNYEKKTELRLNLQGCLNKNLAVKMNTLFPSSFIMIGIVNLSNIIKSCNLLLVFCYDQCFHHI